MVLQYNITENCYAVSVANINRAVMRLIKRASPLMRVGQRCGPVNSLFPSPLNSGLYVTS